MKQVNYMNVARKAMAQIRKGAFLTVAAGDRLNTMTIGWATLGYIWQRPVLMVAVRDSRHTFKLIEKAADFTVSVPSDDRQAALDFCGTKSGREVDKFKECGLAACPAQRTHSPIIQVPGIHFECRIVYKTAMDPAFVHPELMEEYPRKDFHSLYFGEILACYKIE
jgi:flavin reductase (DIM6/NTAB) family NADH-FMN oxidoreductase RutF